MSSSYGNPRFSASYEPSFEAHRVALGLSGPNFDYFFRDVEAYVCDYPWQYSTPVPDGDGVRMLPTRDAFPDIPPLYIYYRVEVDPNRVVFLGLSAAWSQSETF